MAYACIVNENGLIGVFGTKEQAVKKNFGPAYARHVIEVADHEHTSFPVPNRGVFFHKKDQSYPLIMAELCSQ